MFDEAFSRHAARPCVRSKHGRWSYAEVLAMGRERLAALPPVAGLVILRCSLSVQAIAAYVALMDAGHVPLLIEDSLPEELLAQFISIYRPTAVIHPAGPTDVPLPAQTSAGTLNPDLRLLLTTSGSTGSPKLVRFSLSALRSNAEAIASYLEIGPEERPYLHLPMSYSYGLSIINSHLLQGAEICLASHTIFESGYWGELKEFQATSLSGVPFHYSAMRRLGEAGLDIPSLRILTQAGGKLDPRHVAHFAAWAERTGRRFVVMYGQTEAGPRIAYLPPDRAVEAPDAIGIPIPGVRILLTDEEGREVRDGEVGEIVCHSPAIMMGYAHSVEDLALGDQLKGTLPTGDLAIRGDDGLLRIVGRRSRVLKIYGLRINVDEVEQQLRQADHEAICFGEEDMLRILVQNVEPRLIREQMLRQFALPARGFEVRSTAALPSSPSGKVSAATLAKAWEEAVK